MINIQFGSQNLSFELPFDHVDIIQPKISRETKCQSKILINALNNPLLDNRNSPIGDLQNKQIAIAVNDQTRPLPHKLILPELLNFLKRKGATPEHITFYISTGTHRQLTKEELEVVLPNGIKDDFASYCHNCDEKDSLFFLGNTSMRTPVYINKKYYQSDVKIVVGNIEPHHFMGFSGGVKTAAIGLTGRLTIETNHSMLTDPNARLGTYLENPMRRDVEEIGKMINVHFALNVVLNDDKEIIAAFWGDPLSVMEKGIPVSLKACQIDIQESECQFDLVIASVGGYPKDINLYQSQKALTNACLFSRENGVIILAAECRNGSGNTKLEQFMENKQSWQQVMDDFQRQPFHVGPHKAFLIGKQAVSHKIILLSSLPYKFVQNFLLTPAGDMAEAVKIAEKYLPSNPRVAVLPYATHSLPILNH